MLHLFALLAICCWFSTVHSQVIYVGTAATWIDAEADCKLHSILPLQKNDYQKIPIFVGTFDLI